MIELDRQSLLVFASAEKTVSEVEEFLQREALTLDVAMNEVGSRTVREWIDQGGKGRRNPWLDPADQFIAGLEAQLTNGHFLSIRPSPRRSVGPDLTALFVGCHGRFGKINRVWIRVYRTAMQRPTTAPVTIELNPPLSEDESRLFNQIEASFNET